MSQIGVLGAGQLAKMLAQAGEKLGIKLSFLAPEADSCAAPLGHLICADYTDENALKQLQNETEAVTFEFENVALSAVEYLEQHGTVYPCADALRVARDRLLEKTMFQELGIETPKFAAVDSLSDLEKAVELIGLPAILKTRTQGYDGKGQAVLRANQDLAIGWESIGKVPAILESMVPFEREISVIATRAANGECKVFPISENIHREGILRLSLSREADPKQAMAAEYAQKVMNKFAYVGTMAFELFVVGDHLYANEIAPRVHNSGHWTIEACVASQFENHLRAVAGLDIVEPVLKSKAAMINTIGFEPDLSNFENHPNVYIHRYGKAERAGRKIGHITVLKNELSENDFSQLVNNILLIHDEHEIAASLYSGQ